MTAARCNSIRAPRSHGRRPRSRCTQPAPRTRALPERVAVPTLHPRADCPSPGRTWGASGAHLGRIWGAPGAHLGRTWDASGAHLGRIWGASRAHLGRIWGAPGAHLGRTWGASGGASGAHLGAAKTTQNTKTPRNACTRPALPGHPGCTSRPPWEHFPASPAAAARSQTPGSRLAPPRTDGRRGIPPISRPAPSNSGFIAPLK